MANRYAKFGKKMACGGPMACTPETDHKAPHKRKENKPSPTAWTNAEAEEISTKDSAQRVRGRRSKSLDKKKARSASDPADGKLPQDVELDSATWPSGQLATQRDREAAEEALPLLVNII